MWAAAPDNCCLACLMVRLGLVNPCLIRSLSAAGLNVMAYNLEADDFALTGIAPGAYRTLVIAHVLEHFNNAANAVRKLLRAAKGLGVEKIVIVVPGSKGFASDATHKTSTGLFLKLRDWNLLRDFWSRNIAIFLFA